ncbi:hypothetical protein [Actinocorallia populi]|uniref:hypothetical protein n=1 Tax=Actinocorallia populi TaxID=2079200 RepID=UPI0018E56127|nr:hypothetical protein [Actinocorallia populi]
MTDTGREGQEQGRHEEGRGAQGEERQGKSRIVPEGDPADRGPGAHSGLEERPRPRVIPGTGSAAEGYAAEAPGPEGGTRQGDPLKGRETDEEDPPR